MPHSTSLRSGPKSTNFRTVCRCWLLALLSLGVTQGLAQTAPKPLPTAEKVELMTRIYADVKMYFAHWSAIPKFDLNKEYSAYVQQALQAPDRASFDLATLHFFAQLHNGHTTFYDSTLWGDEKPAGFSLRKLGETFVVDKSSIENLPEGSIIRQIAGQPTAAFVSDKLAYVTASSPQAALHALSWMPYLFPTRFTVTLDDGKVVPIDRATQKLRSQPEERVEGKQLEPGVALIRIPSFNDSAYEQEARRLLKTFREARVLIIDVRGNGGGTSPERLTDDLIGEPWQSFSSVTPMHIGYNEALGHIPRSAAGSDEQMKGILSAFEGSERTEMRFPAIPSKTPAGSQVFGGQLLVLSDSFCASACEDFLGAIKVSKRGTIIGENSDGTTGQPYMEDFGDGFWFRVGAKREYLADGTEFEGVGIVPDIIVSPSLDDLRFARDRVMERAMEAARKSK
jgi:carboxyl-terminal processing protease